MVSLLPAFVGAPERNRVYNCDALTLLKALPSGSVQLIAVDWPYNGVKDDAWDNQWATDADYLDWMDAHLREMKRVLAPNGSYYGFASPRMAARVEIAVGNHFNVLNQIAWAKPFSRHNQSDKEAIRGYFPQTERIIFAEQYGADHPYQGALIDGNSTYWGACETAKISIFGDYLRTEFNRAGVTNRVIAALFPSITGGLTGCVSNWLLGLNVPTPEQYHRIRDYLNRASSGDYLRREYEDLRREYEDLRRPFTVTAADPYTDVWTFATVNTYPGKHPCEKPLDMMRHIVRASSRPGDLVLDCFSGSGVTLQAAKIEGRAFIGCDMDANWTAVSRNRVREPWTPLVLKHSAPLDDLPLFAASGA